MKPVLVLAVVFSLALGCGGVQADTAFDLSIAPSRIEAGASGPFWAGSWYEETDAAGDLAYAWHLLEIGPTLMVGPMQLGLGARYATEKVTRLDTDGTVTVVSSGSEIEPALLLSADARVGVMGFAADAGYSESGLRWGVSAGYVWQDAFLSLGWRAYPIGTHYSGPVVSVGVTF